jgi:hypothetical protein
MIVLLVLAAFTVIMLGRWRMSVAHCLAALAGWVMWAVMGQPVAAVVFGMAWAAVYLLSLGRWPKVTCARCRGSDKTRGVGIFRQVHRSGCRSRWCSRGSRVRVGVRVLNRRRAQDLMAG